MNEIDSGQPRTYRHDNQRILRLDNLTANQIAAGEVIERPVSVVKELVENAVDAGSSVIKVEFREGGLSMIRLTDNGGGIDKRDLAMAIERHATSKLRQIEDLNDLSTLGFRGEALASIASVASLEIVTRKRADIEGYRLRAEGAEEEAVVEKTGCPVGTQVTVEHLFFNTPARLKFMKSPGYEGGLIHDLMIQMALGYPEIGFRLENQGKVLFDTVDIHKTEDLVELFYGKDARQALIPVEAVVSKGVLSGWITAPPYSRGTRKGLHVFVNGRKVNLRDIQWSIERAFEYVLSKGRFPLAVLRFHLPGELLDVNVHPGKLEIRINDQDLAPSTTRALRTAISGGQLMPDGSRIGTASLAAPHPEYSAPGKDTGGGLFAERTYSQPVKDWQSLYNFTGEGERQLDGLLRDGIAGRDDARVTQGERAQSAYPTVAQDNDETALITLLHALEEKAASSSLEQWGVQSHTQAMQAMGAERRPEDFVFGPRIDFTVIGQLHRTFILAEVYAGLLIVDQHVAHERILYEAYTAQATQKDAAQMLMHPISVSLTTGEEETLVRHILLLNDLGLVLERFGPRQYLIRSEPADRHVDQTMFKELLEKLESGEGREADIENARQSLLVMSACKAAVKANTALTMDEMKALLAGLRLTAHPMTCPHGRPILYLLPYRRLIQAFGRSS